MMEDVGTPGEVLGEAERREHVAQILEMALTGPVTECVMMISLAISALRADEIRREA